MNAGGAGAIDISLCVDLHAIGMAGLVALQRVEQLAVAERAVCFHVENADMRPRCVVDIDALLVRREGEAIGAGKVGHHRRQRAIRGQAKHALPVEVTLDVVAFHAGDQQAVLHLGPVDGAVRLHHDVVRRADLLAFIMRGQRNQRAVAFEPPDIARRPAGNHEPALMVEGHPVEMT